MIVRRIKIVIVFLICFLLQGTVMQSFSVFGGVPDLILVLLTVYIFLDETDSLDGLIAGTTAGLFRDICYGLIVGPAPLMYLAVGGLMFYMKRRLNNENGIILFFMTAAVTAISSAGQWLLSVLFTQSWLSITNILLHMPGAIIWNFVILTVICSVKNRWRRRSKMKY